MRSDLLEHRATPDETGRHRTRPDRRSDGRRYLFTVTRNRPQPASPWRKWAKRGAVLLAVLAVFGSGVAVAAGYLRPASTDNPLVTRGCVIRFDERSSSGRTVPRIHANHVHYCVGVQRVYAEYPSGDLIIVGDSVGPIVSINVTPDETLTARGIRCGPSGGPPTVRIRCYNGNGTKVKAYGSTIYGAYSNLWYSDISWAAS